MTMKQQQSPNFSHAGASSLEVCPCCGGVQKQTVIPTPRQSQPNAEGYCLSLCDYVAPQGMNDHIGAFAITVSSSFVEELEALNEAIDRYIG